jgi:hypothetical protein
MTSVKLKTEFLYSLFSPARETKQEGAYYSQSGDDGYEYPEGIAFPVALIALDSITPVAGLSTIHLVIAQIIE